MQSRFFVSEVDSKSLSTVRKTIFKREASRIDGYVTASCTKSRLIVSFLKKNQKIWDIFSENNWKKFSENFRKGFTLFLGTWSLGQGASTPLRGERRRQWGDAEKALLSPACSNTRVSGWDAEGFCTECVHTQTQRGKTIFSPFRLVVSRLFFSRV